MGDPNRYKLYRAEPEYWEDSWRIKETCRHFDSSESRKLRSHVKKIATSKMIIASTTAEKI